MNPPIGRAPSDADPSWPARLGWPRTALGAAAIAVMIAAVYAPALHGGFVWDDVDIYIIDNPLLRVPEGLPRFWMPSRYSDAAPMPGTAPTLPAGTADYHPLAYTTFWIEWQLWKDNPTGYHAVNLVLHAATSLIIWGVLRRLGLRGAWIAAAIFALHPVNVEAVAWIAQRKSLLGTMFGFAAFWCYATFDDRRSRTAYAAALVLFFLSLAGKPVLLAFPFITLGYAWWRRGTVTRVDLIGAAPFFSMSVLMGALGTWYQTARIMTEAFVRTDSFAARLAGAGWAAWFYAYKALVPIDLAFVYPRWSIDAGRIVSHLPNVALALLFVSAWLYRASWGRTALAGAGFFILSLAPALGFVDIGFWRYSLVGDHYQYQSIIGVIALAVVAADRALASAARLRRDGADPSHAPRWAAVISSGVVLALLGTQTWRQSAIYESEERVWLDTIAKNPAAWMPRNNLANILFRRGQFADAVPHYHKVLELNPGHTNARANLAAALAAMNDLDGAIRHWSEALRLEPDRPEFTRALTTALERAGRSAEALAVWQAALDRHPNGLEPRVGVAAGLFQVGRYAEAESHYRRIIAAVPGNAGMRNNLAMTLARQGRLEEAAAEFRDALRIDPGQRLARRNLGDTLLRLGRRDEAVPVLQEALRTEPGDEELLRLLRSAAARPGAPSDPPP